MRIASSKLFFIFLCQSIFSKNIWIIRYCFVYLFKISLNKNNYFLSCSSTVNFAFRYNFWLVMLIKSPVYPHRYRMRVNQALFLLKV